MEDSGCFVVGGMKIRKMVGHFLFHLPFGGDFDHGASKKVKSGVGGTSSPLTPPD